MMGENDFNFYHVMLIPRPGVSSEDVTRKLDLAKDWIRYSRDCWIVYTNRDSEGLFARLVDLAKPGGELLICKLDISDRQGWTDQTVWNWIRSKTSDREHVSSHRESAEPNRV